MKLQRLIPLALGLLLFTSSAIASPSALRSAPEGTRFAAILHGIGQLEPMLQEHLDSMASYGLEAPDMDRMLSELREKIPHVKKSKQNLLPALGLSEKGSIALYARQGAEGEPYFTVVLDVDDRKTFLKTIEWGFSQQSKVKMKKERLPGKGLLVTLTKKNEPKPMYLRFQGNIAAFSNELKAIDGVQFAGGSHFQDTAILESARLGVYFGADVENAVAEKLLPPSAASVKSARLYALFKPSAYEAKLDVTVQPEFQPFLSVLKPGEAGKRARAALSKLIGTDTDIWWRTSFDLQGIDTLAMTLLGNAYGEITKDFERRAGLPMATIASSFTGDELLRCNGSFSACIFAGGIRDREGAESLIRHFFAAVADSLNRRKTSSYELSVETRPLTSAGDHQMMVTTFSIREDLAKKAEKVKRAIEYLDNEEKLEAINEKLSEAMEDEEVERLMSDQSRLRRELNETLRYYGIEMRDALIEAREERARQKAGKKKKKARKKAKPMPFEPVATLHWGLSNDIVVFGTTTQAIETAMNSAAGESGPVALDDVTFIEAYQAQGSIADFIRQGMPFLRSLLPEPFIGGWAVRLIDAALLAQDQALEGRSRMQVTPTQVTIDGSASYLPAKGTRGYSAALDAAFKRAMKARYGGDIADSNRQLAKLALEHPDSPYGRKADGMAFRVDLAGVFLRLSTFGALMDSPAGRSLERHMRPFIEMIMRGL